MITEQLHTEVEKFFSNFTFVKFEVYEFFENRGIYWIHSIVKIFEGRYYDDDDAYDMIDTLRERNWSVYDDEKVLKYIVSEFNLWSNMRNAPKYKIAAIRLTVKKILDSEKFVKTIKFNPLIKELINEGRHKVKSTYPEELKYRSNVSAQEGDKIYVCDNSNNLANPGYVLKELADGKLKVAYFTNVNKDRNDTTKLSINGWARAGVHLNEIGLTPEQSIKHRLD
jgi:hypothetical protein